MGHEDIGIKRHNGAQVDSTDRNLGHGDIKRHNRASGQCRLKLGPWRYILKDIMGHNIEAIWRNNKNMMNFIVVSLVWLKLVTTS